MIYNIVLVSDAQQSDLVTCRCMYVSIFFLKIFFPLVYYKIVNIVPWIIQSIFKDMKKKAKFLLIISYNSKGVKGESRHHPQVVPPPRSSPLDLVYTLSLGRSPRLKA